MEHVLAALPPSVRRRIASIPDGQVRELVSCRGAWPEMWKASSRNIEVTIPYLQACDMPGMLIAIKFAVSPSVMAEAIPSMIKVVNTHRIVLLASVCRITKEQFVAGGNLLKMINYELPGVWIEARDAFGITAADILAASTDAGGTGFLHTVRMEHVDFGDMINIFHFTRENLVELLNIDMQHGHCFSCNQHEHMKRYAIGPFDVKYPVKEQLLSVLKFPVAGKFPVLRDLYGHTGKDVRLAALYILSIRPGHVFSGLVTKLVMDVFGVEI